MHRGKALHGLQEQRQREQQSEFAQADHQGHEVSTPKGSNGEQSQVNDGDLAPALTGALGEHQGNQRPHADDARDQHNGDAAHWPGQSAERELLDLHDPAVSLAFDQGEHHSEQAGGHQDRSGPVHATPAGGVLGFRYHREQSDEHDDADRQIDQEGPVPGCIGGQVAADERS